LEQSSIDRRPEKLSEIVENGMCMGCGLCQAIAAKGAIQFVTTPEGRVRPIERNPIAKDDWEIILRTCPRINVIWMDERGRREGAEIDMIWGPYHQIVLGYASDPDIRFRAASGGVLTALAKFLVDSGRVSFILQVCASESRPMRSVTVMSRDSHEVIHAAGSRYGPTAPLDRIQEALDTGDTFAFIGKPCDVTALRLYAREDARVDKQCLAMLALVCGGGPEFYKSRDLVHKLGYTEDDVTLMRYRGYGKPGRARIETRDGKAIELTYQELWDDESKWCSQARCKICPDGIGESADIVSADFWPGCNPTGEDAGFNSIMVRSDTGMALFKAALAGGALTVERTLDIWDMSETQPHQVRKKEALWAHLTGMKAAGHLVPHVDGLRVSDTAGHQSFSDNLEAARGARVRCKNGRFSEPPVVDVTAPETGGGEP